MMTDGIDDIIPSSGEDCTLDDTGASAKQQKAPLSRPANMFYHEGTTSKQCSRRVQIKYAIDKSDDKWRQKKSIIGPRAPGPYRRMAYR